MIDIWQVSLNWKNITSLARISAWWVSDKLNSQLKNFSHPFTDHLRTIYFALLASNCSVYSLDWQAGSTAVD